MMKKTLLAIALVAAALTTVSCNKSNESANDKAVDELIDKYTAGMPDNEKDGQKFIDDQMKKDKDLKKTASGLVYKITKPGTGPNFTEDQTVKLNYVGRHINGQEFDSSAKNGGPVDMPVGQVVAGFKEMLLMMNKGCKAYVIMPGNLAYGSHGAPSAGIGPNETLVFEIEAVDAK